MKYLPDSPLWCASLSLIAGALITVSLAPFNLWPAAIASLAFFFYLNAVCRSRRIYFYAWCFGFGLFFSGVSWVYISIHDQSNTPTVLAVPMTLLWCAFLALFCTLFAALYRLCAPRQSALLSAACAAALWVLCDWLRGWILGGFPWLYIAHSQIDTPLAGWVPLGGVFSVTLIMALSAAALSLLLQAPKRMSTWLLLAAITLSYISGQALRSIDWTQRSDKPALALTMIQANIAQEIKWLPTERERILQRYRDTLQAQLKPQQLFIFPETALPDYLYRLEPFLDDLEALLIANDSGLLTGVVATDRDYKAIYNSIISLGEDTQGVYHKRHLVPFGEFVPFEWLRKLVDFFNLPMSHFSPGPERATYLQHQQFSLAPFICYEIAFPNMVRTTAAQADALLTISNDTWFGRSLAPHQHMQFARFRALENGRYLIRSTNNGITAIVDEKGRITARLPQFEAGVLSASIPSFTGLTPYNRIGNTPVLLLCFAILFAGLFIARRQRQRIHTR